MNWRSFIWSVIGILGVIVLAACNQASSAVPTNQEPEESRPTVLPSSTPSATPSATPTPEIKPLSFLEPTPTVTSVAGGRPLVLFPEARDVGWVVSEEENDSAGYNPPNHFGDSYLYAGVLDQKIYHGAIQFDLSQIPRGTKIYAASLRLTGLRVDRLNPQGSGSWRLQLLSPEIDYRWRTHDYQLIHKAEVWSTFLPTLTGADLGIGQTNLFEFTPDQLDLLEARILEGSGKISFRLDGPERGDDNLFAWDSGSGLVSKMAAPELFLSLGPPPAATPPLRYVVITSTPTPQNMQTAVANSLRMTAEAQEFGTATPLPPNWVTPIVVTPMPTPDNEATAQALSELGTAIAITTGQPPNLATATPTPTYVIITSTPTPPNVETAVANSLRKTAEAQEFGTATPLPPNWVTPVVVTPMPTPGNEATAQALNKLATAIAITTGQPPNLATATSTPTYVIITSTPTPLTVMTAAAQALQVTAEALQFGPATPFPPNWVTPVVVTSTPTPANGATAEYSKAILLTTGTPTPLPGNAQTATPTPVFIAAAPIASPTATATPTATPQPVPPALLGKIIFLSDREGASEEERLRAAAAQATPQVIPQPYVYDPATGQLSRLTDKWPYAVARVREAWSADTNYETYTKLLLWTNVQDNAGVRHETQVLAIHYYDYHYKVEQIVTRMGSGIVYDPVWSPVSNEIAFVATESGNDEIWTINHDGTNPQQLTRNTWEWDKHPSWSPDGQQIVFYSNRSGNNQLWIMNKDGSDQRPLMEWNPYNDSDPIWIKYLDPRPPLQRELDWRFTKPPNEGQGSP